MTAPRFQFSIAATDGKARTGTMGHQMDTEDFSNCSNDYEREAACPKSLSVSPIALMNREFMFPKNPPKP